MGSCLPGMNVTTVNTHLIDYINFSLHLTEKYFSINFHLFPLLPQLIDLDGRSVTYQLIVFVDCFFVIDRFNR